MGNRHELRSVKEHRLALPGSPTVRPPARVPSSAAFARMAQEATIPSIPAARRPPRQERRRTRVRPYVRTGGRTQSKRNFAIEAMISVRNDAPWNAPGFSVEFHSVRTLCRRPTSVAEVAASLCVPLGVAKVLLGDMAELGLVTVHETQAEFDGHPALALMERVLQGLRRL
ncbi:Protein of unknown function [Amycolatopsis lurida]|uniref:DUF742 domain-containing protein n=2 Tax=Pseudonocardiaceae TaxID=2070 RepID=A0A2P2FSN0_AMYLU|nr:hypothetical protein BB31_18020 [Amycolatopsis lurida NRRL 2430]QXV60813.1 DUF742 domain-containing protein [Amycolatopsis sp. TNS106]SED76111.1 Protein of unknown function [Amycolatopsis lurida]